MAHSTVATHEPAARPPLTPTVGVFLCRCATGWRPGFDDAIARWLERWAHDLVVIVRHDLCRAPHRVARLRAHAELRGAVISACAEQAGLAPLLRRVGIWPWAIESVDLSAMAELAGGTVHVERQLAAAVARVRALLRAGPEHLKVTYGPQGERCERRALLRFLLEPAYQVVPAVDRAQCLAARGCGLCLDVCPARALRGESGSVAVQQEACTACGACVTACPAHAITRPGLELVDLDAQLEALLAPREGSPAPPRLILTCAGQGQMPPHPRQDTGMAPAAGVVLALPCAASISPALLLRAFERGARSVAMLGCAGVCPQGLDRTRIRRTVGFATQVLAALGLGDRRLALVEGPGEEGGSAAPLPCPEASMRTPPGIEGQTRDGPPTNLQDLSLPAILGRLRAACGSATVDVIAGEDVPFGQVQVHGERPCTLCGVCIQICPTQALGLVQDVSSEALTFAHARCVGCGLCVEQCPETIVRLDRALDLSDLDSRPRVLARAEVICCRHCQQPIAPASMLAKVQGALCSLPQGRLWDLHELCPSCRLAKSVGSHADASAGKA
ncbi:MAG TPA: 4Fe-4S binding protein [Alphaproteobacteria bacterium]|nr:4Fe-4S binding protein [Alphaproteobacteria bacterium]